MTPTNSQAIEEISQLVYTLNEMIAALVNGLAPEAKLDQNWKDVMAEAERAIENLDAVVWQDPMAGNWRD